MPDTTHAHGLLRLGAMLKYILGTAYRWSIDNTFTPAWCPFRWPSPALCLGAVIVMQLIVVSLMVWLVQDLHLFRFLGVCTIFFAAFVALNWGAGPVLLASLITAPLQQLLVLPSMNSAATAPDSAGIISCVVIGLAISLGISRMKQKHKQVEEQLRAEHEQLLAEQGKTRTLTERHRRMEEFIGITSHEMRTPLTASIGNLQVAAVCLAQLAALQKHASVEHEYALSIMHDHLQRAERQIWLMNRLVDELLDLSLIQAEKLLLRPAHYDLIALVQEAIEELHLTFPERMVQLDCSVPLPLLVFADRDRLHQVVSNYLTNALKYSADDQPVSILIEQLSQSIRVCIVDHGPGIPQEEQQRIWQCFYRVPGSERTTGLGVGLYICRTIIEQHQGRCGVESAPGAGSLFWFTLPLPLADVQALPGPRENGVVAS